jgi:MoaA/NifB/PqqE/SkfB family radical SAM enzyme|tara:strand:+ start:5569 stop:6807 length:1239 start_codon:yes stop_codon:yes gene_type:complete
MINEKNNKWWERVIAGDTTAINEKNKDVICAAPWSHLYMDTAGLVRPCCTHSIIYGDTKTTSIKDIWNSSETIKFRKNLLAGVKQEGCKFCYQQEKHTGQSLRTGLNDKYGNLMSKNTTPDMVIKYLDIRSSNLCNMACIMCGSEYSSLWYDDEIKLNKNPAVSGKFINITKETENNIIDSILSDKIDLVYFAGGEPLITPYHYQLIEKLISMGISKNVNLRYNTNLSTLKYKSVDLVERWSHFKTVEVAASIDMIGERAELQRYGTDWKKISKNLHTVRFDIPSVSLTPQITVTALSIGYLPELLTYFIDELEFTNDDHIFFNIAMSPAKLTCQYLPKSIKELYTNKLQSFLDNTDMKQLCESGIMTSINSMNEVDNSDKFEDMTYYLDELDDIRPTNWKALWPELAGEIV